MFLSANIQSKVRANTYEIFIKITLFFYILLKNADISAYITIVFLKFRQKYLLTAGVHTGRSMVRTPGRSLLSETFLSLFFAHHIKKGNISKTISPMLLENPVFRPPSLFRLFIYSCTPAPPHFILSMFSARSCTDRGCSAPPSRFRHIQQS